MKLAHLAGNAPGNGPILLEDLRELAAWKTRPPFYFDEGRIIAMSPAPEQWEWVTQDGDKNDEYGGADDLIMQHETYLRAVLGF